MASQIPSDTNEEMVNRIRLFNRVISQRVYYKGKLVPCTGILVIENGTMAKKTIDEYKEMNVQKIRGLKVKQKLKMFHWLKMELKFVKNPDAY